MTASLTLPVTITYIGNRVRSYACSNAARRWWQFWKPRIVRFERVSGIEYSIGGASRPVGLYVNSILVDSDGNVARITESWGDRVVTEHFRCLSGKGYIMSY
jgi:hypothetical protein